MYVRGLRLITKLTIWLMAEIFANAIAIDYLVDYSEFLFEQNLAHQEQLIAFIGDSTVINHNNFTTGTTHNSHQSSPILFPLPSRDRDTALDSPATPLTVGKPLNPQVSFSPASLILPVLPWIFLASCYGFSIALLNYSGLFSAIFVERASTIVAIPLTIILGLSLSFRIYQSRIRFKTAIKLWQTMGKAIDSLVRDMCFYIDAPTPQARYDKESVMQLGVALAITMKLDWRSKPTTMLKPWVTQLEYKRLQTSENAPLDIALWIDDYLQRQYQKGQLNKFQLTALCNYLAKIIDLLGRWNNAIAKSPSPVTAWIFSKLAVIYFLILPLAIVKPLGLMTGLVVGAIAFVYLILDRYRVNQENLFEKKHWYYIDSLCNRLAEKVTILIISTYNFQPPLIDLPPKAA